MSRPVTRKETEIKLALPSLPRGRALLRQHGFKIIHPRIFEANIVLDTPDRLLYNKSLLLRVRAVGKRVICTSKGPALPGRHKVREEHEFEASSLDAHSLDECLAFFRTLGFEQSFRYEKYRTELARPGEPGHVTLDETPIGNFLELEGPARWIDRTAARLGFSTDQWILSSYGSLYKIWCAEFASNPAAMIFRQTKRRA